ncbi:DUF550 domain-containing protein [Salmonella enterica subsp. enterica serovar Give]|nr:DUF550 domain-containing protein [Salmonella enterica subsp. enterica serovar Give]EAN3287976.1 DUF550 domain-containing protein [Salmonella enterica subsp. enterica serovar Give]EAN3325114.1 DUF550 domain-containing protein [Salmonella enterica subsp. enterica serovar Give]EAR0467384.1 DUF550 domain-containing protein [Salmonella enterica subsp. enterica serovar Poona]MMQ87566.1 DUF550 domain-containing protein [Salmonella enterica subsp. enterica serovar Oranienburg]
MTTITREEVKAFIEQIESDLSNGWEAQIFELKLARIALAALEAEPVAYIFKHPAGELFWSLTDESNKGQNDVMPVYAAPPASERERIRREHAEWSDKTFGNVGPVGPLKHLSKEALEAAADPSDPLEWADMQFLLWDAQRRMGLSDEFITRAMIEKLEINKSRQWPEPKDGEPRLHIKEQPVLVVPEEIEPDSNNTYDYVDGWSACRAAMLQGGEPVSQTYELPQTQLEQVADLYEMQFDDGRTCAFHTDGAKAAQWLLACDGNKVQEYVRIERYQESVIGNSPVIPDGYALVPVEPTDEMIAAAMNCEDVLFNSDESFCVQFGNIYEAMLAAAPQPEASDGK